MTKSISLTRVCWTGIAHSPLYLSVYIENFVFGFRDSFANIAFGEQSDYLTLHKPKLFKNKKMNSSLSSKNKKVLHFSNHTLKVD